ncbi:hypothetical protein TUM19329_18300 [Legionella antarctica]|uniref:Uncharacterized protein n=2 Tax=Legionella antarctica TaxID=2708020 RepID=A0A6F8T4U4_9GAMM|nr:hypothetical protein TUM19329_18300 [Legionella antarctica]
MINPLQYQPKGDKENSSYFNEYKTKIFERRLASGLEDLYGVIWVRMSGTKLRKNKSYSSIIYS